MSDQTLKELRRKVEELKKPMMYVWLKDEKIPGSAKNEGYNIAVDNVLAILDSIEEEKL